ncbi:hypothetical protein HNR68_004163 [Saccharopolyspora hordei]|uniref:Uncharacterized protein n=1 Tax=Saccharopolyspora hordei TaxID=1838 RepID=A0A853AQY5_9PSEU|nr:hypothetical protein [Saccharopolyspora hordei]
MSNRKAGSPLVFAEISEKHASTTQQQAAAAFHAIKSP